MRDEKCTWNFCRKSWIQVITWKCRTKWEDYFKIYLNKGRVTWTRSVCFRIWTWRRKLNFWFQRQSKNTGAGILFVTDHLIWRKPSFIRTKRLLAHSRPINSNSLLHNLLTYTYIRAETSKSQMETLLNVDIRVNSIWHIFYVYWLLILNKCLLLIQQICSVVTVETTETRTKLSRIPSAMFTGLRMNGMPLKLRDITASLLV